MSPYHELVKGERPCGRDIMIWSITLYWVPMSEHGNELGSHSQGYHSFMEEKDLLKLVTSGHRLYSESALHFFSTITFETLGYILETSGGGSGGGEVEMTVKLLVA